MVAPLIVGTTRVIAGKKTAQRINAAVKRPQLLRKIKARERRKRREENPLTDEQKQNLFNKNK